MPLHTKAEQAKNKKLNAARVAKQPIRVKPSIKPTKKKKI